MGKWRLIMNRANVAMRKMLIDKEAGEIIFQELIDQFGADGMIFYKRAQAYEDLGCFEKACSDYKMAKSLFPMATWIDAAKNGIMRVCNHIEK